MVRAMYCEMLGYEADFAYIHAIKLAQQGTVLEKRVGMYAHLTFIMKLLSCLITICIMLLFPYKFQVTLQYHCFLMRIMNCFCYWLIQY